MQDKGRKKRASFLPAYLHHPHFDLGPVLGKALDRWQVQLPPSPCLYRQYTDDFGIEIKELLLSQKIDDRVENKAKSALAKKRMWDGFTFLNTADNMMEIGRELGISVKQAPSFFYPRDLFVHLMDGSIRMPYFSKQLQTAIMRTHSGNLYLDKTAATRTKNQLFNSWTGYSQLYVYDAAKTYRALYRDAPKTFACTYVEGGNVFTLTNKDGTVKVLAGCDHLAQTLHILDLEKRPWDELAKETHAGRSFSSLQEETAHSLTNEEMRQAAEEMFSQGVLLQNGKSGLIDKRNQLNLLLVKFMTGSHIILGQERGWLRNLGEQAGIIPPFAWAEEGSNRAAAAAYLAKKAITRRLMAKDFKAAPEDLHFITQANYHLDLFLRPGPKHSIFLMNFAIAKDILEAIATSGGRLSLSQIDREHLQQYLETAGKLDQELGPLLEAVKGELEAAGFTVIPMPGHLLYEPKAMYQEFAMPSGGWNINFINALTGWSPVKRKPYYITHGLQVGERLGGLLMDAFAFFLNLYAPGLELYFIGRDPDNVSDFSEAMDWWNRLETQSGIHCATFELSTASHTI